MLQPHHATRTFHPPQTSRRLRRVLGVLLAVLCVAPLALAVVPAWLPTVRDIDLNPQRLHLQGGPALLSSVRDIPLAQIRAVRQHHVGPGRRHKGTRMDGHCSGWWRYQDLGEVWQATDCRADVLLVETDAGRLLLSAQDMNGLRLALQQHTPFHDHDEVFAPRWLRQLVGAVGIGALAAAVWIVLISFQGAERLAYVVGPDGLTVRYLGGARHIALRGAVARRVCGSGEIRGALVQRKARGVRLRIAGVAMPGYFTGLYWRKGGMVRLWATRLDTGILIESDGRFLVTPEHEEAFLEALQAFGAEVLG